MSLSFVSKAVQTIKEDGGYEEQPIEGADDGASKSASAEPLFEQLRANKEKEEAEREEFQRSVMRGTLALDEEDCAHLDQLQQQKIKQEVLIQQQTQQELAAFRAARAERLEKEETGRQIIEIGGRMLPEKNDTDGPLIQVKSVKPPIVVKKRRRRDEKEAVDEITQNRQIDVSGKKQRLSSDAKSEPQASLGGLLSGYGSSSDSERE